MTPYIYGNCKIQTTLSQQSFIEPPVWPYSYTSSLSASSLRWDFIDPAGLCQITLINLILGKNIPLTPFYATSVCQNTAFVPLFIEM